MKVIPAIDLLNGVVVRLIKGELRTARTYEDFGNPVQVAKKWEIEGASIIHVIDLDAAKGRGDNIEVVGKIIQEVEIPIQLGGGIRSCKAAEEVFSLGVKRIIFGTMAFEKPSDFSQILSKYGKDRVMVALDYLNDHVMIRGWRSATKFKVEEALNKFIKLGVENFLLTSITQDGLLRGPDYTLLEGITENERAKIYAAGGIGSLNDLKLLKNIGVAGAIIGKSLYEGRFTLKEAIRVANG